MRILQKLSDEDEEERKQIFRCLSLLENMLDADPVTMANKLMHVDTLIDWLLLFQENGDIRSENHLQSAELLITIVQNSHEEYKSKFATTLNGMERIFCILNRYRKDKQLETEEEYESVVNLVDIVCALLLVQDNLELFRKLQAFELLLSLSKKQKLLRRHVVKVLDYALSQQHLDCRKNSKHFIEAGGLPIAFGCFMRKGEDQKHKKGNNEKEVYVKVSKEDY